MDYRNVNSSKHIVIVAAVGIGLIILAAVAGCGSVDMINMDDAGGADTIGVQPDVKPDTVPDSKPDTVAPGRPLGAGCTLDNECGSGICAKAPGDAGGMCCNGKPNACASCVGGYIVAASDGVKACGTCRGGRLIATTPDGTSCGAAVCSGARDVPGFPGGDNQYASSSGFVCRAGACVAETTDCRSVVCPASCKIQYKGCVQDRCWCVDTSGSVCNL